jgi:anaerobic selenocysteine-containing dehydrogenase
MAKPSRRDFLVATGAGAAAAGAIAVLPGAADAATETRRKTPAAPANAKPLVVHLADPDGDELRVHRGNHTTVVHDRDLVVRILHAAKEA